MNVHHAFIAIAASAACACSSTVNEPAAPTHPDVSPNQIVGHVNGRSWSTAATGVYVPSAPVITVVGVSPGDSVATRVSVFLQNVTTTGVFQMTGFRAGASITAANDSTYSTGDPYAGQCPALDNCIAGRSFGQLSIIYLTEHRIIGTYYFTTHNLEADGSFDVSVP
jgi:hypothetical protein